MKQQDHLRSVIISRMTGEDCRQVCLLQQKCLPDAWSLQSIREMFERPGYYNFVARTGEKIIGYVGLLAVLDEADITNVVVDPDYRRQHTGTRLLDALLALAGEEGIRHIFLEVRRSNHGAIQLYEKAGFSVIAIRKNYYEQPPEDALIMRR